MTDSEQYKKELQDINSRLTKLMERWDRDGRPENPFEEPTVKTTEYADEYVIRIPKHLKEKVLLAVEHQRMPGAYLPIKYISGGKAADIPTSLYRLLAGIL